MKTAARAASAGAPSASCQQRPRPKGCADGAAAPSATSSVIDGVHATTLKGNYEELFAGFQQLVDTYVDTNYRRH